MSKNNEIFPVSETWLLNKEETENCMFYRIESTSGMFIAGCGISKKDIIDNKIEENLKQAKAAPKLKRICEMLLHWDRLCSTGRPVEKDDIKLYDVILAAREALEEMERKL